MREAFPDRWGIAFGYLAADANGGLGNDDRDDD